MRELVVSQRSRNVLWMLRKIIDRNNILIEQKKEDNIDKLYYEIIQKGTYTACVLTLDNEIVGLGMTKRDRRDKYDARTALNVCTQKAIIDYLFNIEPEWMNAKD